VDNADLEDMLSKRNRVMEREVVDGVDKAVADSAVADSAVADSAVADKTVADKTVVDKTVADKQEVQTDKRNSQDRT
jgi:hypothetical protein